MLWEGSRMQNHEATNRKRIEGSLAWDELALQSKVPWTQGIE